MLQRVVLRECASVTPVGVCALLRAPALRRVVVSKCPQVRRWLQWLWRRKHGPWLKGQGLVAPHLAGRPTKCARPPTIPARLPAQITSESLCCLPAMRVVSPGAPPPPMAAAVGLAPAAMHLVVAGALGV